MKMWLDEDRIHGKIPSSSELGPEILNKNQPDQVLLVSSNLVNGILRVARVYHKPC